MSPSPNRSSERASAVDRSLVQRLQEGDTDAFAELYDRYSRLIYGLILRMVRNPPLAEDLLQETFLKVWRSTSLLDCDAPSPGPWLMAIARNHALDYLKSGRNQRSLKSGSMELRELSRHISIAEYDFVLEERGQQLRSALQRLEFRQRQVLELTYFEGLTQTEIALALHLPLGTVKSCVRLALRNLKSILEKENL